MRHLAFRGGLVLAELTLAQVVLVQHAIAQDLGVTSGVGANDENATENQSALPGLVQVGSARLREGRIAGAVALGYGFTEPQNGQPDPHHSLAGSVAASFTPFDFAAFAAEFTFRHDVHGSDALGQDSGTVLSVTPLLRGSFSPARNVFLGLDLRVPFSGAASGVPTADVRALGSYLGLRNWGFHAHAGYRSPQGGPVLIDASQMRPGDRVTLGLSQYDALLVGLGAERFLGRTEVLAEITWDVLVGGGAPPASQSPLRAAIGARHPLTDALSLFGGAEVVVSARAPSLPGDPLVPIDPRLSFSFGATYAFDTQHEADAVAHADQDQVVEDKAESENAAAPAPETLAPAPAAPSGSARVTVVDGTGHPISDATVVLRKKQPLPNEPDTEVTLPLESMNLYAGGELPEGDYELVVRADLLKEHSETIHIKSGEAVEISVNLLPAGAVGSQLRGLVRSFSGQGVQARVRVVPGAYETKCGPEGQFVLELPPGDYEVIIEADGFTAQRRTLRIRSEGVTVLNADLSSSTP